MKKVGKLVPSSGYQSEVPESAKLTYQFAYFKNSQDWYSSLVDSGTSQGTRVNQTQVPIYLILKTVKFVPEFGKFTL